MKPFAIFAAASSLFCAPLAAQTVCEQGCLSGDCENGSGIYQYKNCAVYSGQFKDEKRHGFGNQSNPDTSIQGNIWENDKLLSQASKTGWTFVPGIGYFIGFGSRQYIGKAIVDAFGVVSVTERRHQVTRLFPTLSALYRPERGPDSILWKNFAWGFTIGINEGADNEGNGFALAMGLTIGAATPYGHFGVFLGTIADPSVRRLPSYIKDGQYYPTFLTADRVTGLANALALNQGIEIPLESASANYGTVGFVYSVTFD